MAADHPFLPPVAERVGPFAQRSFIEVVMAAGPPGVDLLIRESNDGFVAFERNGHRLGLAGHEDLVDYRSPRGDGARQLIMDEIYDLAAGDTFGFDSLPRAACDLMAGAIEETGCPYRVEDHTTTAVLELPASFDDYLASLSKKERHEMRRKRRRYEDTIGPIAFHSEYEPGELFERFVEFHRQSPGDKGSFMTPAMERYFAQLLSIPGWTIDALIDPDHRMTAAGFGYFDETGYYLYNSTYDPALAAASPGVVLLGSLIEMNIDRRSPVFDFLKGDEAYKYRLGAEARQLYRISSA